MTHVAHRLLLRLYPDRLRHELGDEIQAVFNARLAAARRRGPAAVVRLLLLEIRDSVRTGLRARWSGTAGLPPARQPRSPRERALQMFDGILSDLRAALRLFRTAPAFALAAVTMLAVAIGANTAMFSVIDAVLLRPLPMQEPDRLVSIYETNPERGWTRAQVAAANYLDWRERTARFDGIAAHNDWLVEKT